MSVSCLGSETGIGTLCGSAWSRESQQPLPQIICDKILFSHTRRWYEFLFLHFFLFRYLLFYVIINFYRNYYIVIIIFFYFFSWKLFLFFHVPGCSGMFRHVPECSRMFHVPGFIDALEHYRSIKNALFSSSGYAGIGRGKVWKQISSSSDL